MGKNCLVSFLIFVSLTAVSEAGIGTSGFDLLRRELSASNAALGSATVAYQTSYFSGGNPATLSLTKENSIYTGYVNFPVDLKAGQLGYNTTWKSFPVATRFIYFDYGSFDKRTVTGQKVGTFSAYDWMFSAVTATSYQDFSFGCEVGYLNSSIETYSATAILVNTGVIYNLPESMNGKLGIELRNLGANLKKYGSSNTELPTSIRVGGSKKLEHLPLTLMAQLSKWKDTDTYFAAGGEVSVSSNVFVRIGYNSIGNEQKVAGTKESTAGFAGGFGVKIKDYQFDFAYELQGVIGDKFYLQLNWSPQNFQTN